MIVKDILDLARKQIGTTASNVKRCKYNTWFYGYEASGDGYDWCAVFISWLFAMLDAIGLIGGKNANCGYLAKQFENKGRLIKPKNMSVGFSSSDVKPGDVVFYHWSTNPSTLIPGTYVSDHVGIVESVGNGTITAIEGNTGSNPNGAVLRQVRSVGSISCIGRPDYDGSGADSGSDLPEITYRARVGGRWLPEVTDLTDYAGIGGEPITDIAVKASSGLIKYRVHIKDGDWLDYVTGYNIDDDEFGYAGDGKPIDAVEVYYFTPEDIVGKTGYLRAKYRVSPVDCGYYDWQYDSETDADQDGYAGDFGKTIDRLQITLSK